MALYHARCPKLLRYLHPPPCISRIHRHASTIAPATPVLENPPRYNPPSHGKRSRASPARSYGPELTKEQVQDQDKRYYPNMMPPEGTFLHWFITNRGLHIWITMGTLTLLASFAAWENWCRSTIWYNGLPRKENILRHPIDSFWQFMIACIRSEQIKSLHPAHLKDRRVEDMCKNASYRKAIGGEKHQDVEFWPEFERKYGNMVINPATGRLVDQDTLPNKGVRYRSKLWFGIF